MYFHQAGTSIGENIFLKKSFHPIPWRDSISRPVTPPAESTTRRPKTISSFARLNESIKCLCTDTTAVDTHYFFTEPDPDRTATTLHFQQQQQKKTKTSVTSETESITAALETDATATTAIAATKVPATTSTISII
jgi:hypothetical protein